ncbi:MAG: hypothetical protein Q9188_007175 [Gyalolechia gomerana]
MPESAIDTIVRTCLQPMPEIQGPIKDCSPNSEGTKEDVRSKPQGQEPRVPNRDNDDAQNLNLRVRYVKSEVNDNGDRPGKPGKHTTTTIESSKEDSSIAFMVEEISNKNKTKDKTDIILKWQELRKIMYGF